MSSQPELVSYTLPCHKREADLRQTLPRVIAAANVAPPVEILIVDYGHPGTLVSFVWSLIGSCAEGVTLRTVRVERAFFHMAHARNVGITRAAGDLVVAFLADVVIDEGFFGAVRQWLSAPSVVLKWQETFAFRRSDILSAGGFDERFEFYGPEGKELTERLERRGCVVRGFSGTAISQIPTSYRDKVINYRHPSPDRGRLTRREMHHLGMAIWRENTAQQITVANQGVLWGAVA